MAFLLTNIIENTLTCKVINESFKRLRKYSISEDIKEIFYIQQDSKIPKWDLQDLTTTKYEINMDNPINTIYDELVPIIGNVFEKGEFVNVIVDNSFLAYAILEIVMKKFEVTEVFILDHGKLKEGHPCSCNEDTIGIND
jgi:hypothetical protein